MASKTVFRTNSELDKRAAELGQVVQGIVQRFKCASVAAANGPHVDLTIQETRVLELLGAAGGQMMRAVADYLGIAVNSVTSLADNLERKGLLRRVRSEADRRVVHVELTELGLAVSHSVSSVKAQLHREMLAALTDEEQAILLVLLRKIGGMDSSAKLGRSASPTDSSQSPAASKQTSSRSPTSPRKSRSSAAKNVPARRPHRIKTMPSNATRGAAAPVSSAPRTVGLNGARKPKSTTK